MIRRSATGPPPTMRQRRPVRSRRTGKYPISAVDPVRRPIGGDVARDRLDELARQERAELVVRVPRRELAKVLVRPAVGQEDAQQALDRRGHVGRRQPEADRSRDALIAPDGAANAGQDPISVAQRAEKSNISIFTVALGTASGSLPNPDPFGPPVAVPPDPQLMQQIARTSHGRSFSAQDADGLISIYKGLGTQLGSKAHETEITVAFAAAALALLLVAGVGSLRWSGRLP